MSTQSVTRVGLEPLLNVIFHGSFAYVVGRDGIEAMTPDVPEHAYKAGTFGGELRLTQGRTYQLSGVAAAASPPVISPVENVVFNVQQINREALFCSFKLPFPDKVTPFRFLLNPIFQDTTGAEITLTTRVQDVQVLTYRIAHRNRLTLEGGFSWTPDFRSETQTANLHIFAYEEFPVENTREHYQAAGTLLMSMFPDIGLIPVSATKAGDYYAPIDPGIRGVRFDELDDLIQRNLHLPHGYIIATQSIAFAARSIEASAQPAAISTGPHFPVPIHFETLPDCLSFFANTSGLVIG
jgi:hypothetical protein